MAQGNDCVSHNEGVLLTEKEGHLADFDAEDFKRTKENQRFCEQKLKDQQQK